MEERKEKEHSKDTPPSNSQDVVNPEDETKRFSPTVQRDLALGMQQLADETSVFSFVHASPEHDMQIKVDESKLLGKGSGGTCVFEGVFRGRQVAVKRMLK